MSSTSLISFKSWPQNIAVERNYAGASPPFSFIIIESRHFVFFHSGPVLALGLARKDAVSRWRDMLGPKEKETAIAEAPQSLRAQFSVEASPVNQIHGSDSLDTAEKEIEFFFPKEKTLAIIKPNAIDKKG